MAVQFKKEKRDIEKTKEKALEKAIILDSNGQPKNFHWKNDDAKKFIDFVVDESGWLLKKFRIEQMTWPTKEIAFIMDTGKFLRPGGTIKRTYGTTWEAGSTFANNKIMLQSKKVEWMFELTDDEIDDNIEGKDLEAHIKAIIWKKIANELVEAVLYARRVDNPSGVTGMLNMFDWVLWRVKNTGNVINAALTPSRDLTRKTLIKGKKAIKTKYRSEAEYFLDSDIKIDLDELYNDPNWIRGNWETIKDSISGIKVNEVPLMRPDLAFAVSSVRTKTTGVNTAWLGKHTINVADNLTTSLNPNDSIVIRYGEKDEVVYTVVSVAANSITIEEDIIYNIPADSTIHKAELNASHILLTNPKNLIIWIQRDIQIETERNAPDGYKFWYKMKMDIQVENPEAALLIENLKSKD